MPQRSQRLVRPLCFSVSLVVSYEDRLLKEREMKIVLASESPLRKRALDLIGLPYETQPSRIDEKAIRDDNPAELTRKLAEAKAPKIAVEYPNAAVVQGTLSPRRMEESSRSPVTSRSCDVPKRVLWKPLSVRDVHRSTEHSNRPDALHCRNFRHLFPPAARSGDPGIR